MPGVVTELPLTGNVPGPSAIVLQLLGPTTARVIVPVQRFAKQPVRKAVSVGANICPRVALCGEATEFIVGLLRGGIWNSSLGSPQPTGRVTGLLFPSPL